MPDKFAPCDEAFLAPLRAILPPATFRETTDSYTTEPRGRWKGQGVVLAPANVDEVSVILKAAHAARVAVIPHTGGTGLVGGQIMPEGALPLILSLARMNRIRATYPTENVIVAEAGVTVAAVQDQAKAAGRLFPLQLASDGSCGVGGVLATNAGGTNVLRYGNARALCLGVEAVMADGRIWNGLTRLRKDNAGYDLRDLLIGSEGTLAVITAAALRMVPDPAEQGAAIFAVASPEAALDLLALVQKIAGEGVTGFELISRQGLDFMDETDIGQPDPVTPRPDWLALVDLGLPRGMDIPAIFEDIFTQAFDAGLVADGTIAANESQRAAFWRLRETIPEGNRLVGSISSHDISVPLSEIPAFLPEAKAALEAIAPFRVNCFGHLGDGNLHYNVFAPKGEKAADYKHLRDQVQEAVHAVVASFNGSVAAEHGVGRLKVRDLERHLDPVKLALMRQIKATLDPHGILNPGAVLAVQD